MKADEVKIVAVHYVDLFKTALEESDAEIKELRAKAEQKRERARVRAAQRKREKAEREAEQQNMVREQVQEPVEPQPTYSNNGYYAQ